MSLLNKYGRRWTKTWVWTARWSQTLDFNSALLHLVRRHHHQHHFMMRPEAPPPEPNSLAQPSVSDVCFELSTTDWMLSHSRGRRQRFCSCESKQRPEPRHSSSSSIFILLFCHERETNRIVHSSECRARIMSCGAPSCDECSDTFQTQTFLVHF